MSDDESNPQTLSRDEMEDRRLLAARYLQAGFSQAEVSREFGVTPESVHRWNRSLITNGVEALRKRPVPGCPRRLTEDQLNLVADVYRAGPRASGFDAERWTTTLFAEAIFKWCGVHYDPSHVGRILHRLDLVPRRARASM